MLITDQPMKFLPQVVGQLHQLQILHTILQLLLLLFFKKTVVSLGKVTHCYECVWDSESLDGSKACSESEGEMGKEDLVHECDEELGHVSLANKILYFCNSDLATFYSKSRAVCVNVVKHENILFNFAISRTCASSNTPVSFPNTPQKIHYFKKWSIIFSSWHRGRGDLRARVRKLRGNVRRGKGQGEQ